jgi:hypothetical protein
MSKLLQGITKKTLVFAGAGAIGGLATMKKIPAYQNVIGV